MKEQNASISGARASRWSTLPALTEKLCEAELMYGTAYTDLSDKLLLANLKAMLDDDRVIKGAEILLTLDPFDFRKHYTQHERQYITKKTDVDFKAIVIGLNNYLQKTLGMNPVTAANGVSKIFFGLNHVQLTQIETLDELVLTDLPDCIQGFKTLGVPDTGLRTLTATHDALAEWLKEGIIYTTPFMMREIHRAKLNHLKDYGIVPLYILARLFKAVKTTYRTDYQAMSIASNILFGLPIGEIVHLHSVGQLQPIKSKESILSYPDYKNNVIRTKRIIHYLLSN